jgi:hypothetical protein
VHTGDALDGFVHHFLVYLFTNKGSGSFADVYVLYCSYADVSFTSFHRGVCFDYGLLAFIFGGCILLHSLSRLYYGGRQSQ